MKTQIQLFFTALMFYTRIPCPKNTQYSPEHINKATRYFPLIGWIVGLISFLAFWIGLQLFDIYIAIILSLMAGVLTTGAFHEDGLADVFDGFGGGWTKTQILDIMKDSRIGTYGTIALIFLFILKFFALNSVFSQFDSLNLYLIALLFVSYHALARLTAINIVFTSQYSRADASSKSKPIAKAHTYKEILGAYIFGLTPLIAMCFLHWQFVFVLLPLFVVFAYSRYYFNRWIDGYTGDCLGAVEQIAECVCILSFFVLWKFM